MVHIHSDLNSSSLCTHQNIGRARLIRALAVVLKGDSRTWQLSACPFVPQVDLDDRLSSLGEGLSKAYAQAPAGH